MKKILLLIAVVFGIASFTASATPPIGGSTPVDSTLSTTNIVQFPLWPNVVAGGVSVTNWTKIDISGAKEVALNFSCASTNAGTTSNIVWQVYESAKGTLPTNAAGTSVDCDLLGTVTNVLNGTTRVTTVAKYNANPRSASTYQSADTGIAGVQSLYVGIVTVPALSGITNYQVVPNLKY